MKLFREAILFFCIAKLLRDAAVTESTEVAVLLSSLDKEVNASSPVKLRCVAYGSAGLSAPSIEWTSVRNGRTSTIANSTSTRHTVCLQSQDTFTESKLNIEDTTLDDTGLYSCTATLNVDGSVLTARKATTLSVFGDEANPEFNAPVSDSIAILGGALVGGLLILLLLSGALIVTLFYCGRQLRRKYNKSRSSVKTNNMKIANLEFIMSNSAAEVKAAGEVDEEVMMLRKHWEMTLVRMTDKSEANIKELFVPKTHLKIMNIIGEGEFSHVHWGTLTKKHGTIADIKSSIKVAVKMLRGSFDEDDIQDLIRESVLMYKLNHRNVLSIIGLCLDAGPSPYIILPFMENGNLRSYVKKNKARLYTNIETDEEEVCVVEKQLTDMCLQSAKGMEYLANTKLIHRDLAARNCMIDENWVIKVADFGLSEIMMGSKDYFRQNKEDVNVKLPVKWMAPESLEGLVFSEKSDVWSYGVTCWELFSAGRTPYPGIHHPMSLAKELINGRRPDRPGNTACSDKMYTLMNSCWEMDSKLRPGFSQLVKSIGQELQSMTGYLYVSAFNNEHAANPE